MTNNIVASISEALTPELIGKLAAASGLDRSLAGKAANAAVPIILNSLAELVTKPGGARRMISAMGDQPTDLEGYARTLIGPSQAAASGNNLLSSLLGNSTPNVLASSIAKLLGVSTNSVQTLLGLITPLVLGGLRRVQRASGLDAEGLAEMLSDQKDNIAEAIPAGLSSYLRKSGISDVPDPQRPSMTSDVKHVASSVATKARSEANAAKTVAWPYWALAVAALGGLLWALLPRSEDHSNDVAAVSSVPGERSMLLPGTNGKVVYITRPNASWRSIGPAHNEYVERTIYSPRGEAIGTVRDLLVGPDGKAAAAVINVSRYLGIGDKVVAVPFTTLRVEQHAGDRRLVVDLVKEALQTAPQFENNPASKQ